MSVSVHIPVLCDEMREALDLKSQGVYVDATYGGGGYTQSLFDKRNDIKVIGLDRDPDVAKRATRHTDRKGFTFVATNFGEMESVLSQIKDVVGNGGVDGVVMDIGVSSFQIDEATRGFSFMQDGPLDMRMDNASGQTAADIINTSDEKDLADIFYHYGEERHSRRVARAVVGARPIETTKALADVIEASLPRSRDKAHPATRCFQALRIAVNDELGELERGLEGAEKLLKKGGRLVVVTFHSLEDRIVKKFMAERSGKREAVSRYSPVPVNENDITFKLITKKPVVPTQEEVSLNPRARSAKMRVAEKTVEWGGALS